MRSIAAKRIAPRLVTGALLSALVWLAGLHGAEAGVNVWTTNGPEGGTISALAIDPQSPGTVYAGTLFDGVFKSTDGGGHWSGINAGLTDLHVQALAIGAQTPTTLYAGTRYSGVFKSTDGGGSWNAVLSYHVGALAIDPKTPTTDYAGNEYSVYRSTDGGATWSTTSLTDTYNLALVIDPHAPPTPHPA